MFVVTESDAAAIRAAYEQDGELSAAIELRRLFLGLADTQRPLLAPGPSLNGSRRYFFCPRVRSVAGQASKDHYWRWIKRLTIPFVWFCTRVIKKDCDEQRQQQRASGNDKGQHFTNPIQHQRVRLFPRPEPVPVRVALWPAHTVR
jgi:hypothetical protein